MGGWFCSVSYADAGCEISVYNYFYTTPNLKYYYYIPLKPAPSLTFKACGVKRSASRGFSSLVVHENRSITVRYLGKTLTQSGF